MSLFIQFELDELQKSKDEGLNVTGHNKLIPQNGKGNVKGNTTNTDQLIKKDDDTYKVVETKLSSKTKLSTGQNTTKNHVEKGNQMFEVRSNQPTQGLKKGDKIRVTEFEKRVKYEK